MNKKERVDVCDGKIEADDESFGGERLYLWRNKSPRYVLAEQGPRRERCPHWHIFPTILAQLHL